MREALYAHRYESAGNLIDDKKFEHAHVEYRATLQELYSLILRFQAMYVCYCSRDTSLRLISDLAKWDKWNSSLQDIEKQDQTFCKVYEILKDWMTQEEYDELSKRHEESSKIMESIAEDISALKAAIEKAQSDQRTRHLLQWLSPLDPSGGYRNALEKRKADTGDWLLKDHAGYESWKKAANTLLWLHGKGNYVIIHIENALLTGIASWLWQICIVV